METIKTNQELAIELVDKIKTDAQIALAIDAEVNITYKNKPLEVIQEAAKLLETIVIEPSTICPYHFTLKNWGTIRVSVQTKELKAETVFN